MLCRAGRTWRDTLVTTRAQARHARRVFKGATTAWTGVHISTSLFPEIVPEIDANPEHKRLNLYEHYCSSSSSMLEQALATRTTRSSRQRNKWNFGFIQYLLSNVVCALGVRDDCTVHILRFHVISRLLARRNSSCLHNAIAFCQINAVRKSPSASRQISKSVVQEQ